MLITLEENMVSVQQFPLCLPLLFEFSSEVLNSDMKSYFDGAAFLNAIYEECFVIRLRCLHLEFLLLFLWGFVHKSILVSLFLPLFV